MYYFPSKNSKYLQKNAENLSSFHFPTPPGRIAGISDALGKHLKFYACSVWGSVLVHAPTILSIASQKYFIMCCHLSETVDSPDFLL